MSQTIRVARNEAGNCISFFGSTNPTYFNACLSAEVDPVDNTLVNVVNDIFTAESGEKQYEFYHIPFTSFRDVDNNPFASAQEAADYITLNGNVVEATNVAAQYKGVWDADTNTPDLTGLTPTNGDWFYVNVAGTYDGVDYNVNDVIKWNNDAAVWNHVPNVTVRVDQLEQEVSEIIYSTESALFNNNALVYADGDRGLVDPDNAESGWYYKNTTEGIGKINWYYVGNQNPENTMTLGTLEGMYAVLNVKATGVPHFNVYTMPTGGFDDAQSWYRTRTVYNTPGSLDAHVGSEVLIYWGQDPVNKFATIPHIEMVLDASNSEGPAGSDENVLFGSLSTASGTPEGTFEFIAKTLGYQNNTHVREYLLDTNDPAAAVETTDVQSNTEIDFTRDDTNTSVILDHDGTHYGVNTIKAVAEADGSISIYGIGDNGEPLVTNIQYDKVTVAGQSYTSINSAVNALNALITVNPYDPTYEPPVILPVTGDLTTTVNLQEGQTPVTGDPTHLYVTGADTSSGHGARAWTDQTIDRAGEFFDVKITGGVGRFILGLVDVNDTDTFNELTNDSGNGHSGLTWGNAFYDYGAYTAPWTTYGKDSATLSMAYGPGWNGGQSQMMRYNVTGVQDALDNMEDVVFRVGLNDQGYIYVAYYDAGRSNTHIMTARTSKIAPAGNYALVVKLWSGNTTLVEAPTVALLADVSAPPTSLGDENITIFGEGITGTLAGGITSSATDNLDNDGFVSEQKIGALGEYFEFEWSAGANWNFGLFSENDHTVAAMAADTTSWGDNDYIFYGARAQDGGGIDNRYSEASLAFDSLNATVAGQYYGRVGFDSQGRPTVWQSSDGITWAVRHRAKSSAPAGDYRFIAVAQNAGAVFDSLQQGTLSSAPTLAFRYIESPDGNFQFPLFATAEEANYYEEQVGNPAGGSHTHVFEDAPTSIWYMPNTAHEMNGGFPPEGANLIFQGQTITYTEIPSLTNSQLTPPAFAGLDFTFSENASVSLQITPADASWTTVVTGLPTGLNFDGGSLIQGTTPYVPATEDYTVTVTRTNNYGSVDGTFVLTVQDNPALGDLAHFTEFGGNMVQPNRLILTHDALLQYDTVLSPGQQLTYSYSQNPPTIGILNATGQTNLDNFDPSTDTLGDVQNVNNFAQTNQWALRYVSFGGFIGANTEKHNLVGWTDNSTQTGADGDNVNIEFKLEYGNDGYIRLYRGGVLKLTSLNTFSGDQTLTFAGFDDQQQTDVYTPSNLTITNIGAGSTDAPVGFVSPLLVGEMGGTTLLGNPDNSVTDSAVQLTDTLDVNHRFIFPQTWLEANVLPHIGEPNNEVFIGVPKVGADFTDVDSTDFLAVFKLDNNSANSHNSKIRTAMDSVDDESVVNSLSDAFFDYGLEWDGENLHVIACSIGQLTTEPAIDQGGAFTRVRSYMGMGTATGLTNQALDIVIAVDGEGQVNLTTADIQHVRTPWTDKVVLCGESSSGNGQYGIVDATYFDLGGQHAPGGLSYSGITSLDAGQTYTFIYHASMEDDDFIEFRLASDNTTVYNTGITAFDNTVAGDPSYTQGYKGLTFAVPSDAPPLRLYHYNDYQSGYYDAGRPIAIAGSTYTEDVTGITPEGPIGNQPGTAMFQTNGYGWSSIDEKLGAGERLVFDNAFMVDLVDAMPDNTYLAFGPKDSDFSAIPTFSENFIGGFRFVLQRYSASDVRLFITRYFNSVTVTSYVYFTSVANISANQVEAFLEITSSGNNIRGGITDNTVADDVSTSAYADWYTNYKVQTGDQGWGISEVDIMIHSSDAIANGSNPGMDSADVDWTGLSEVSVPTPPETNDTPWTKALDFSGSAERAEMVSTSTVYNPMMMAGTAQTVAQNGGLTSGHPWATACVFKSDGHSSNQHIWNIGEGAGSTDDNIALRIDAGGALHFEWGRDGARNSYLIATNLGSAAWYGVTVAHKGMRFSGADATNANLSSVFSIHLWYNSGGDWIQNPNTLPGTRTWTTTGGRMDRSVTGSLTIGGRGSNRNFHGKVASFVTTTLKNNDNLPSNAELKEMLTDPMGWLATYKEGNTFRRSYYTNETSWDTANLSTKASGTQVFLMGDGMNDSYSNMIRNQVAPTDQNYTKLNLLSMVSNDIENVSIPGLS